MFYAFESQAVEWHVQLLSRIAIVFAVLMIANGVPKGDVLRVGSGVCWIFVFSALIKWWDCIKRSQIFNVMANIILVGAVVMNNVGLLRRLQDEIPNTEQLTELMTSIVWSLIVPTQCAVMTNCEFIVLVLIELFTFVTLLNLPAAGVGYFEYWWIWTAGVMVTNLWFGYYLLRLKRETFLLLLACGTHVHEDHLEQLQARLESKGDDEESALLNLELPELAWDKFRTNLEESINWRLRFHDEHQNIMYRNWKQSHSSAFLTLLFTCWIGMCFINNFRVYGWELGRHVDRPGFWIVSLLGTTGFVISLIPGERRMCWNAFIFFSAILSSFLIPLGLDMHKIFDDGHEHRFNEDFIAKKFGHVLFGYTISNVWLANVGVVAGCDFLVLLSVAVTLALVTGISVWQRGLAPLLGLIVYIAVVQVVCSYQHIRLHTLQALWKHRCVTQS